MFVTFVLLVSKLASFIISIVSSEASYKAKA
jgi:hypothetical protein